LPTYEYKCNSCGKHFEIFQSMKDEPQKMCPVCHKESLKRLIGTGAGIIFKGSGFYQTDYRSESYKKAVEKEKKTDSVSKDKSATPNKTNNSKD